MDTDEESLPKPEHILARMICDSLADRIGASSNDHHLIVHADQARGQELVDILVELLRTDEKLRTRIDIATVKATDPGQASLAELWGRILEDVLRNGPEDTAAAKGRSALDSWNAAGRSTRPVPEAAELEARVLSTAQERKRQLIVVIDDLEAWTVGLARRDEEWGFRKTLQTEPSIVVIGHASAWSADTDPGRALYHGLSVHRIHEDLDPRHHPAHVGTAATKSQA